MLTYRGSLSKPEHGATEARLRQNNPTGRFSLSSSGKSLLRLPASCLGGRGVGHRHERWDGMRWTRRRRARDGIAGRASKLVSDPWDALTSGAEAYGEVVWSWSLNGWRQVCEKAIRPDRARMRQPFAGDGDNKARFSGESTL
jgi:hypothetical protein